MSCCCCLFGLILKWICFFLQTKAKYIGGNIEDSVVLEEDNVTQSEKEEEGEGIIPKPIKEPF